MSQSIPAVSNSSRRIAVQAARASFLAKLREHVFINGAGGYVLVWVAFPVITLGMLGLLYRSRDPALLGYAVIGITCGAFISNALYYVGQILDEERLEGTLINLFLTPAPRLSWLSGFAFGGLFETLVSAACTVLLGTVVFGVRFHPNIAAVVLCFLLFILALWGLGFMFSALGLILKRSNDLANLLSSFVFLLGGIYYPVSALPVWLRVPADVLPFGVGIQALAAASLHDASFGTLAPQLVRLEVFAAVLPVLGLLTFGWLERKVRRRGDLEIY
ncbi:MAG TPA: ABC transporter permease [Chloroflexota bacterium]|nr:ABC transporter permease [Chloroflexota bacterium]